MARTFGIHGFRGIPQTTVDRRATEARVLEPSRAFTTIPADCGRPVRTTGNNHRRNRVPFCKTHRRSCWRMSANPKKEDHNRACLCHNGEWEETANESGISRLERHPHDLSVREKGADLAGGRTHEEVGTYSTRRTSASVESSGSPHRSLPRGVVRSGHGPRARGCPTTNSTPRPTDSLGSIGRC